MGSKVIPFWGVPYRILNIHHKKEQLWSLWVGFRAYGLEESGGVLGLGVRV